jgi:5-enolpyruvylshikimate-3-phosphate synthase
MNLKLPKIALKGVIKPEKNHEEFESLESFFWLLASALGCDISLNGVRQGFLRENKEVFAALQRMGLVLCRHLHGCDLSGSFENPVDINASLVADCLPMILVAGALGEAPIRFVQDGHEAKAKLKAAHHMATSLGLDTKLDKDGLTLKPARALRGGAVDANDDTSLVFGCVLASVVSQNDIVIMQLSSIDRMHPRFWNLLNAHSRLRV